MYWRRREAVRRKIQWSVAHEKPVRRQVPCHLQEEERVQEEEEEEEVVQTEEEEEEVLDRHSAVAGRGPRTIK